MHSDQAVSNPSNSFNHWLNPPCESLLSKDYAKVAQFYEELIESEPENVDAYWCLGLAYLLEGKEEEAQLTWFIALNTDSEEKLEQYTESLLKFLSQEGDRLEAAGEKELAWLIRGHIREINPSNLNNLLKLVCLDLDLKNNTFEKFKQWMIIELVDNPELIVDDDILIRCLDKVTKIPTLESVEFAKTVLKRTQSDDRFVFTITNNAGIAGFDHRYPIYAADLMRVCIDANPLSLKLIHTLYWFYTHAYYYDEAISIADEFLQKSQDNQSLIYRAYNNFCYLYIYLLRSDWLNVIKYSRGYIESLNDLYESDLEKEKSKVESYFMQGSLITISQLLIYVQDKPKENRKLNNLVAKLFQENCTSGHPLNKLPYKNSLDLNRPLKIGYIGHTFRNHSVGWLCRWLIQHRNREQFKVYLYALNAHGTDVMREWFEDNTDAFCSLQRDVEATIKKIREDEIDILIDLDSLTLNNTCYVMAFKPAPVQATWLGQDASGIPAIDYFIADPYVLPPEAESYYSEKIWRLPHTYLGIDGFEIGIPTLRREELDIPNDAIIYMNFQGALKRYPDTIRLQFQIVKAVPNSYFLIKGSGDQEVSKQLYTQLAQEQKFPLERIRFLERDKTEYEHRANLQLADVVLDTYPYNGATTTLEVLWSEIPLVTKVGKQFAARNSYTFMINAGITEGIAWTDEEYVEWGIRLGTDGSLRKEISWKLRQSKKIFPLWNGKQFTRDMEDAYRQMWEIYVAQNKDEP
jgi:predicted O-linked N-acetylglucosamine transferase (SPINDLY family)